MQLKMSKPFNAKLVRRLLQEENKYITDLFSKVHLPISHTIDGENEEIEHTATAQSKGTENSSITDMVLGKLFSGLGKNLKRAQTFEELHAKLENLKNTKRLDYKQKLKKKSLKNKIKKKTKKEERLMEKKLVRAEQLAAGLTKPKKEENEVTKVPKPKPVFNSEGHMVFSKFDFSEIGTKKRPPKTDKNPKKILEQLEHKKEKLKDLEQTGKKEKADRIKEKEAWKAVLAKSSGEKVKDDPELLKRTIKREEQKKKHSAKKWESRIENVQKMKQERQDKRKENIMKRKKDKKVNKLKKAAKKGRIIPGY